MPQQSRHYIIRFFMAIGSLLLWVLSFKVVRDALYRKIDAKANEKIIDVKTKLEDK